MVESKNLPNLDLVRSLAVCCVLYEHLTKIILKDLHVVGVGKVGVLFFFVHTTFVLMFSMERHENKFKDYKAFLSFYIRRIFRIYPLSIFFILVVVLFKIPSAISRAGEFVYTCRSPEQLIANILLVQNIFNFSSFIGQYWSLPLEVQMYVLLPFVYIIISKFKSVLTLLISWFFVLFLIYITCHFIHGKTNVIHYAPAFIPGAIAYFMYYRIQPRFSVGWLVLYLISLVVLFVMFRSRDVVGLFAFCLA